MEEYTLEELREILTIDLIDQAFTLGITYARDDYGDTEICFPTPDDPNCEASYILVGDSGDWNELNQAERYQKIVDTLLDLVEDDPESYATEVSYYTLLMQGR